jgi:hypothetical protein
MDTYLKSVADVPQPRRSLATPDLRVLPVDHLVPHEYADDQRSSPLIDSLQRDGMLKNPPLVAELDPQAQTFIVLDGANRVTAFRQLGYPHILAQVTPYEPPFVELHTWYHVVSDVTPATLEHAMRQIPEVEVDEANVLHARAELARRAILAYCIFADGKVITLAGGGMDLRQKTDLLQKIVETYIHTGRLERTNSENLKELLNTYTGMAAAFIYPQYELVEVIDVTQSGFKLPPGLTRHIVHGRALRLNYPLDLLTGSATIEEKNTQLLEWTQERFKQRRVRFYAEATYLFDE